MKPGNYAVKCFFTIVLGLFVHLKVEALQTDHSTRHIPPKLVVAVQNIAVDPQVEIIKQQVWENLRAVPLTDGDYESKIVLRIGNGNIVDADCKLIFPKSSWTIASLVLDDYKEVLKKTNINIFAVIYRLITDKNVLSNEIYFNGLWRPFGGSHIHPEGRGIDIGYIRTSKGSGCIFNAHDQPSENAFANNIRQSLTKNFPVINQYFSPWFMCSPLKDCKANTGQTPNEKTHLNHLHLTLNN